MPLPLCLASLAGCICTNVRFKPGQQRPGASSFSLAVSALSGMHTDVKGAFVTNAQSPRCEMGSWGPGAKAVMQTPVQRQARQPSLQLEPLSHTAVCVPWLCDCSVVLLSHTFSALAVEPAVQKHICEGYTSGDRQHSRPILLTHPVGL